MQEILNTIYAWAAMYGLKILGALIILVLGFQAVKLFHHVFQRALRKATVDEALILFSGQIIGFGLKVIVVVAALNKIGFQTTSLIAVLGAAGLAIGLALQSQLSNLAAGVLILFFKPFKLGDYIEAAGISGSVEGITMLTTQLKTPDGKAVIVPNTNVFGNAITNYSAKPLRRIDLVYRISYRDDLLEAKQILTDILSEDDRILDDPAPMIAVSELTEASVNFIVRPWVKAEDYWPAYYDLQEKVKLRFDQSGLTVPFPQYDLTMHQAVQA